MNQASARAFPNIALVKYWGKQDTSLILPVAGSLSLTLDTYATTTTVRLDPDATADSFTLNGVPGAVTPTRRVTRFLDLIRELAGSATRARVDSRSEIPTDAGLASSAAGFAALAVAAGAAYGLELDSPALSRLARRGSGSAARSIISGLAVWHAGDDAQSFAEPIGGPEFKMIILTLDRSAKRVSSRDAMVRTADTSPFYAGWISSTAQTLDAALAACRADDFTALGLLTELHALRMHALIQSADPPIRYLKPASVAAFDRVEELRAAGLECYATADAGPNVVVIARPADADQVAAELFTLGEATVVGAGPGATLLHRGAAG